MNETQRKRLLKLADFIVEQVPEERFNMGRYGGLDGLPLTTNPNICGTAACALGWCTVLFKKLGVHFRDGIPRYKDRHEYGVGVTLFGLDYHQSEKLFTGAKRGRSAKQVRRDILRLVARLDKGKKPVYISVGTGGHALEKEAKQNGWKLFSYSGSGRISDGWCGGSALRTYYIKKP